MNEHPQNVFTIDYCRLFSRFPNAWSWFGWVFAFTG